MSFINFNNRTAPEAGTYSARMIAEALYQVETKNINKIKSLVESIKEPLATAEALNLFENKLVALNALQTAAANAIPVNEGQFSWMTQDTGEQIGSERENRITVYMYDNEGNQYKESKYEGYGEFGGMDYYELLARMNGYTEEDLEEVKGPFKELRQLGIDVAFGKLKTKDKGRKVLYPALVTDPRYNWKKHDFTQEPENDPNQSWYVEPEYDEEYYEAQKVEEAKSITKIQKEWAKVTAMMKDTVDKWKAAEGQEKEDLKDELKTLTISKKKLEAELDAAVGLKDADAELVGEAKNEIKYYKTISKKDWDKAPKDYKSTIDGERYMMFLDDKLGSILAPVKVEEAYTEDDINTGYGFYGTINMEEDDKTTQQLFDRSVKDLMKEFKISEKEALAVLNSKMGRKAADQIIDGQSKTAVDALKDYYGKSLKKDMNKVIAANEGLNWDALIEKINSTEVNEVEDEIEILKKKLKQVKGNTPAAQGKRAAIQDDIDRLMSESTITEADMNDPVLMAFRAAKMKREKELAKPKRKPLYGKQRQKAEDDLWNISQDLKDLYADRGQMLIDMEQEAEAEGGPIADEYGGKLNKIEDQIQKLIAKRNKLEMRLAESFINEEEDYSDEMTYGQLERCIDYATMLRERYDGGFSFDPWMHSAVNTAKNELNSVFDALDGGDGVVEQLELTEGVMSDLHQMAGEVKDEEEFVKQFFKEYGAKIKKNAESTEWVKSLYKDTVNESAQPGEWIAYIDYPRGKKLVKVLKSHRAAVRWNNKNVDDILMQDDVEGVGIMSKEVWDKKEAQYAIESVVTEAKKLDRDEMMIWLEDHLSLVRTSEEFDGAEGGIWTSGEDNDTYKNKVIYDYYSEDIRNREFGVLNKWEKELNKRGWYSEWYDPGTVMIWPM